MLDSLPGAARDVVLLLARGLLGVVLVAHGWQKFMTWGIDGTTAAFTDLGVPLPSVSATFAAVVELVGGVLLILRGNCHSRPARGRQHDRRGAPRAHR